MLPIESLLDSLTFGSGGGAKIKSVQHGSTDFPLTDQTMDIAISPVDLSKSFVVITFGNNSVTGRASETLVSAALPSDGILRLSRRSPVTGSTYIMPVNWFVVEFSSGVSVQAVTLETMYSNGGVVTATISEVDIAKTFLVGSHTTGVDGSSNGTLYGRAFSRVRLANSTTVELTCFSSTTYHAFIVEVE